MRERFKNPEKRNLLPVGITGFRGPKDPPLSILSEKDFRRMCHAIGRENGRPVTEVDTSITGRNFYYGELGGQGAPVYLLQNIHYPCGAFARRDAFGTFTLVDRPAGFRLPEGCIHFLGLAQLNRDWHGLCEELGAEEWEQIRYWKPQTVGEIIFNHWD